MPTTLHWSEIVLRLALTAVAGGLIGFNRGEHGQAAGLRTTLLVCLAASVAMIQANLLLGTAGRTSDSFVMLDLMRLPLGILSGMGFIGGGAILRRDDRVLGITTAATLWFVTVVGLCFGGGQIALGVAALTLCLMSLEGLRWLEQRTPQDRHATLNLATGRDGPTEEDIRSTLQAAGFRIAAWTISYATAAAVRRCRYNVEWRGRRTDTSPPAFMNQLAQHPGVLELEWSA